MKSFWSTVIIAIVWIASTIAIVVGGVPVFTAILLTFAVTFYLIIFGIQKQQS